MLVSFCVVALFLLLPAAVAISRLTGETGPQPTPTLLPFDVTTVQDVSTPQAVRLQISVSTGFPVSKTQIKEICRQVVDDFTTQQAVNAVRVLLRDEYALPSDGYSIASCQYAPEGVWRESYTGQAGEYAKHWLVIEYQPKVDDGEAALVDRPTAQEFNLCQAWDLLTQDEALSKEAGFEQVAGENGVSALEVRQAVSKCTAWAIR
jgi:hypothetical protein